MHQIIAIAAALFMLPLLMPSLKWVIGCVATFTIICLAAYLQHYYSALSNPTQGSPGDGLGIIFSIFFILCFSGGTAAKLIYIFTRKHLNGSQHKRGGNA
jgi:hypothetical protein